MTKSLLMPRQESSGTNLIGGGKLRADQFDVIARVNALIREGRMRPNHCPARVFICGLKQMSAAQFLISLGA